jgi:hypothetical protein
MRFRVRFRKLGAAALAVGTLSVRTVSADDAKIDDDAVRTFASVPGAFSLRIPSGWFVKEIPSPDVYEGYFSRERIDVVGDVYSYGVNIVRLKDFSLKFRLHAKSSQGKAREYVDGYAAQLDMFGNPQVKRLAGDIPGMETSSFELLVNVGTPSCVWTRILVGLKRKEWFHAIWEVPCDQRDAKEAEIETMIKSLVVSPSWPHAR